MVVTFIVFSQIAIFGLTDTMILIWYGSRNPTYKARRQWKIDVLNNAEVQKRRIRRAALRLIRSAPPGSPPAQTISTEMSDILSTKEGEKRIEREEKRIKREEEGEKRIERKKGG